MLNRFDGICLVIGQLESPVRGHYHFPQRGFLFEISSQQGTVATNIDHLPTYRHRGLPAMRTNGDTFLRFQLEYQQSE
jgi:hypothetical protein